VIRFVDLGHQLNVNSAEGPRYFAWFDTVSDHFLDFGGEQTFNTWDEFVEVCDDAVLLERVRRLFPAVWEPEAF
jgi:hypothetical protein